MVAHSPTQWPQVCEDVASRLDGGRITAAHIRGRREAPMVPTFRGIVVRRPAPQRRIPDDVARYADGGDLFHAWDHGCLRSDAPHEGRQVCRAQRVAG